MVCPKCQSTAVSLIPAEVRLFRNSPRTLSHPPMIPSPDIQVCLDCGLSAFVIPRPWLSAGWLLPLRPQTVVRDTRFAPVGVSATAVM
jgi:hypothetical protein